MSTKSKPFYWIVCDAEGCEGRCPGNDYDNVAWDEAATARDMARDYDWVSAKRSSGAIPSGDAGPVLDFCEEHRRFVCMECDRFVPAGTTVDQDGMCVECWAEDQEQSR